MDEAMRRKPHGLMDETTDDWKNGMWGDIAGGWTGTWEDGGWSGEWRTRRWDEEWTNGWGNEGRVEESGI